MQGFNMGRYIPPAALDAGLTSANAAAGKPHALGQRARKIAQGVLTVRFEMPFAVWCTTCAPPAIVAQGVRFNAEKKRVGSYYSTPVWSFRVKHGACGGWLEIRTDPKSAEYVVHEGGKRRDYGEHKEGEGAGALGEILTEEERERRRSDAFAAFEGKVVDREKGKAEGERVDELMVDRARDWNDPYTANQRLRKTFRAERKVRHRKEAEREQLQQRLGLGIELLDENEADRQAASLVEFGEAANAGTAVDVARKVGARPLFDDAATSGADEGGPAIKSAKLKAKKSAEQTKLRLQQELRGNTRVSMDAFGVEGATSAIKDHVIAGLRRKPDISSCSQSDDPALAVPPVKALALVDYDSDKSSG